VLNKSILIRDEVVHLDQVRLQFYHRHEPKNSPKKFYHKNQSFFPQVLTSIHLSVLIIQQIGYYLQPFFAVQ
jgi:hypothetical protein